MGVKACDRFGCDNTMCDRLILRGSKYICDRCWFELLECKDGWEKRMTVKEVKWHILKFMDTEPGTNDMVDTNDEFNRLTE